MESAKPMSQIEKDAARYRLLRAKHWSEDGIIVLASANDAPIGCMSLSMERLDKALDDELQKQIEAEKELEVVR